MRPLWLLAVALTALAGCAEPEPPTLDEFAGRDLSTLDEASKAGFLRRLPEPTRGRFADDGGWPVIWHLWRHPWADGSHGFILFEGHPIIAVPGVSWAAVHFLTPDGRLLGSQEFSTGWRINLKGAEYRHDPTLGGAVIELQTPPAINGRDLRRQVYGVIGPRVGLLRVEHATGTADTNVYTSLNHRYGPEPPRRTAEEWERPLHSSNLVEVLEALTCLSGPHKDATDPPSPNDEPGNLETARAVAEARQRPKVREAVERHAGSGHPWIREAAAAALEQLPR